VSAEEVGRGVSVRPGRRRSSPEEVEARRAKSMRRRLRRKSLHARPVGRGPRPPGASAQRSLVKVSFATNRGKGSGAWRAHGRYLGREAAVRESGEKGLGFDAERDDVPLAGTLSGWQEAGDERLWKVIVSPENGGRMELQAHARSLVDRMEGDLEQKLEWVAVVHENTDHPHVHLAIRGVSRDGERVHVPPRYVKEGLRHRSQELATRELGERTPEDLDRAREAGTRARHVGALESLLDRRADEEGRVVSVEDPSRSARGERVESQLRRRLAFLTSVGLATQEGRGVWRLDADYKVGLRAMQRAGDVQRLLAHQGIALPDAPMRKTELEAGQELVGRVAGTYEEEASGKAQLLVESTDGVLHVIEQTPAIARTRGEGRLRADSVVSLVGSSFESEGRSVRYLEVEEHGPLGQLRQAAAPETVLDREALRGLSGGGQGGRAARNLSRFAVAFSEEVESRSGVLERAGLVRSDGRGGWSVRPGAVDEVERRIRLSRSQARTVEELEREPGRPVEHADPSRSVVVRGVYRGVVRDERGDRFAVVEDERARTLVPVGSEVPSHGVGREVEARVREEEGRRGRQRALAWQVDELDRGLGRG